MGNMLPCLVHGSGSILPPPMNTRHWSCSMKLLVRALRRSTKRRHRHGRSNRVVVKAAAASSSAPAAAATPRTRRGRGRTRRAVRVKVVLTRAEAVELLSLTAHGHRTAAQVVGELKRMQAAGSSGAKASTAAQVISELKRMEELVAARANVPAPPSTPWRPVLESIPEECGSSFVCTCCIQ